MKTLMALLLLCVPAFAQDDSGGAWIGNPVPLGIGKLDPSLHIHIGKSPDAFVIIKPTGEIEYGKDYTPDAAAKALWDAVGVERAARNCK